MTDLTQAIDELRRQTPTESPWDKEDFFDRPALAAELATLLNAVLSGDLIPKADADLALAILPMPLTGALIDIRMIDPDVIDVKGQLLLAIGLSNVALTEGAAP